ncbi:hypothetical protein [Nocardia pneumoniae]|uniref:hypothetical protein n=1 Tax=Nocardia pneumoniae TaxID=228601 RepID=UPI0012F67B15|nr:hypothetical protein [Nocardia pneumoniae]
MTTDPQAGVAMSDGVAAEAAGPAITPNERTIAVAAQIFVILVDIVILQLG